MQKRTIKHTKNKSKTRTRKAPGKKKAPVKSKRKKVIKQVVEEIKKAKRGNYNTGNRFASYDEKDLIPLYDEYCEHVAKGYTKYSFAPVSYKTIEARITENPKDFPPQKLQWAERRRQWVWEHLGRRGIQGDFGRNFNVAGWIFSMRNMFKNTGYADDRQMDGGEINKGNVLIVPSFNGTMIVDKSTTNNLIVTQPGLTKEEILKTINKIAGKGSTDQEVKSLVS